MAIFHAQPLFLLFVSLFFLPAALGTVIDFYKTSQTDNDVMNVTKVEIIPYPIKFQDKPILRVTGVTSQNLTWADFEWLFLSFNGAAYRHQGTEICELTKCPMEPGPFVLTVPNAHFRVRGDDYNQFGTYRVHLSAGEEDDDETPLNNDVAVFLFHSSALARFTNTKIHAVNVTRVEILPFKVTVKDNPVFRITADTSIDIPSSAMVEAGMALIRPGLFAPRPVYYSRSYKLCDSSYHCPIKPGRFVLAFAHPYWRHLITAGKYRVVVRVKTDNYTFMYTDFEFSVSEA